MLRALGCLGVRSPRGGGADPAGPSEQRGLSSRPRATQAPAAPFSGGGNTGWGGPSSTSTEVGSSSGSFPFSHCLHPYPDQHPSQSWELCARWVSSGRFGDCCGSKDTLSPIQHQPLETMPPTRCLPWQSFPQRKYPCVKRESRLTSSAPQHTSFRKTGSFKGHCGPENLPSPEANASCCT